MSSTPTTRGAATRIAGGSRTPSGVASSVTGASSTPAPGLRCRSVATPPRSTNRTGISRCRAASISTAPRRRSRGRPPGQHSPGPMPQAAWCTCTTLRAGVAGNSRLRLATTPTAPCSSSARSSDPSARTGRTSRNLAAQCHAPRVAENIRRWCTAAGKKGGEPPSARSTPCTN
jgi:hypothetical protein